MHMKIYISPSREYYPALTIPLAEMQPKYCIPASGGFVIISVAPSPAERRCTWKFTFPPRGNTIQCRQFRLRKCNKNFASPQAEVCYYFSSCPRLRKCTESCAFPRAEMRSGCCISASRKCKQMCAVPQAVLYIKRSKKIVSTAFTIFACRAAFHACLLSCSDRSTYAPDESRLFWSQGNPNTPNLRSMLG